LGTLLLGVWRHNEKNHANFEEFHANRMDTNGAEGQQDTKKTCSLWSQNPTGTWYSNVDDRGRHHKDEGSGPFFILFFQWKALID
jgi:hypothetical protein